jgi:hypothetical protein
MLLSKSDAGTSITQVTTDAQHNTIAIPAGKGGWLKRVEIQMCPVRETVVNAGGLVRLYNTSADWDPFYFISAIDTCETLGGDIQGNPVVYNVNKYLPGNSTVYSDFTPYDNQTQHIKLTVVWELGTYPNVETFSGYIHPLKAAAVTSTARASPGNYQIPGGKGGRFVYFVHQVFPTLETIVNSGGLSELECDAYDMTPCEYYTVYHTTITGGGGGVGRPDFRPWDAPAPANSTITSYFTPTDDQSQTLSSILFWERAARR